MSPILKHVINEPGPEDKHGGTEVYQFHLKDKSTARAVRIHNGNSVMRVLEIRIIKTLGKNNTFVLEIIKDKEDSAFLVRPGMKLKDFKLKG